jgi:hypothetical protein
MMNIKRLRLVERWERLENVENKAWMFLLFVALAVGFFWVATEPIHRPHVCQSRSLQSRGACGVDRIFFWSAVACLFGFLAFKVVSDLVDDFCRPLQTRAFSPTLRIFLSLKRMRLERVFKSDELELSLTTLDDNHKPYQPFTFKINGIHKFNFYDRDNKPVSADCIFRGGALLEFSRVRDSAGLDCARVMVSSQYRGAFYVGQLELEAESYEIRALPKAR